MGVFDKTSSDGRFFANTPGRKSGEFHKEAKLTGPTDFPFNIGEEESSILPNGFHRPTTEQPEALEAGGERFFSSRALPAGEGLGISGNAFAEPSSQTKQASAEPTPAAEPAPTPRDLSHLRFLGTSFSKEAESSAYDEARELGARGATAARDVGERVGEGAREWAGRVGSSAKDAANTIGESAKGALDELAKNKWAALGLTALGAKAGIGLLGKGVKGVGGALSGLRRSSPPPSLLQRLARKISG